MSYLEDAVEAAAKAQPVFAPVDATAELEIRKMLEAAEPFIRKDERARVLGEALSDENIERAAAKSYEDFRDLNLMPEDPRWPEVEAEIQDELRDGIRENVRYALATLTPSEGSGAPLPEGEKCERCRGRGQVRRPVAGDDGELAEGICPDCHGTGKKPLPEPPRCGGGGLIPTPAMEPGLQPGHRSCPDCPDCKQ